jgi:hypothetical protein
VRNSKKNKKKFVNSLCSLSAENIYYSEGHYIDEIGCTQTLDRYHIFFRNYPTYKYNWEIGQVTVMEQTSRAVVESNIAILLTMPAIKQSISLYSSTKSGDRIVRYLIQ